MKITRKRQLSLILAIVLVLGMLPNTALAVPAQSNNIYQIGTAEDLLWFAEAVNGGQTWLKAELTADIDLSDITNWPGIGTRTSKFAGTFDGKGHTVTFLDAGWGLFGYVLGTSAQVAVIQNVKTAGSVKRSAIAHDAGYAHFTNCVNGATITCNESYVAGIVGNVSGTTSAGILKSDVLLTNCGNEASVTGVRNVGGLIGWTNSNTRLTGCYNTGNIHGNSNVGGLAGYFQQSFGTCKIENSYNTGRVTGTEIVGGIIGCMMNTVTVSNCYNTGNTTYAIAGSRYNSTSRIVNCYYLGTASAKCSPDYTETLYMNDTTYEISTRATAKSAAEMATAEFAALLGSAFMQSCPTPVLNWQTAKAHTGTVCDNCKLGTTQKEVYDVTFQQHDGYTLTGENKVTQGTAYTFSITISDGYEKASGFAVKVNGKIVTPASNGKYTVTNVTGPLSVTVLNVQVIPGSHSIQLPGDGYGYRATGNKTVKRDADYSFTLTFVDGFKAGTNFKVIAQEILPQNELDKGTVPTEITLTGNNGVYTIPTVQKDYRILVSGVAAVSKADPVTVTFTITEGYYMFHTSDTEEIMLNVTLTVPYFDLSLYSLEQYYYNPYCYVNPDGSIKSRQEKGTPESAYDHITYMHALIVATELYYLGYDLEDVGKAIDLNAFREAISWSQDAGSSFMDFWDHGTNLNYYLNYAYPLAYAGWGSTSDQIEIQNGDILSLHMITGPGSGSGFGFFTANDTNNKFNPGTDTVDTITVNQGQTVKLTYFWTATSGSYATSYKLQKNKQLYWAKAEDGFDADVRTWSTTGLGNNASLVTDANGVITISTAGLAPGTYYIGALGGFTEGGNKDDSGFVSAGSETGAAFFKIVVLEYTGKLGDVDGDTKITAYDALLVQQYVAKLTNEINHSIADVDGDGKITAYDALLIQQYVAKIINSFPGEH